MTDLRALLCALGAVAIALPFAAGCGAFSDPEPVPTETSSTSPPAAEHGSYAHCLAEHGIDGAPAPAVGPQPGPAAPPAGVDEALWQQAVQACTELAPGPAGG